MNLISQILFAIVITSFTGTLALELWRLFVKLIPGWNTELACRALRCVCLLYVLPVGYLIVRLTMQRGCFRPESILFMRYLLNGSIRWLFVALGIGWLALSARYMLLYLEKNRKWYQKCRLNVPEENPEILAEFMYIKKKLGIHRKVRLCRNPKIRGPVTIGLFCCTVMLPDWELSSEERKVTFYHELCHIKRHDALFRFFGIWIGALRHADEKSGMLSELIKEWSECDCDAMAVTAMSDEMSASRYFEVILEMMGHAQKKCGEDTMSSMLYENQLQLEKRIDYMKEYKATRRWTKAERCLLTSTFALLSIAAAYTAGAGLAEAQDRFYRGTAWKQSLELSMETELSMKTDVTQEHFAAALEDISYEKLFCQTDNKRSDNKAENDNTMPLLCENEMVGFSCMIGGHECHVSDMYSLKTGQKMSVSCTAAQGDCNYWIGIINSQGNVWYVEGNSSVGHDFEIPSNGQYRVLVKNDSDVAIEIKGAYCLDTL
jgi:beta-lactamase regulating signal transducer with metallopeptidase domain